MALYPSIPTTSESDTFVKGRASYVFEASPRLWVWLHFLNSTRLGKISLYLLEATCQVPEPLTSIWDLKFPVYHINLIRLAKAEMPPLSLSSILLHDPELAKFSRKKMPGITSQLQREPPSEISTHPLLVTSSSLCYLRNFFFFVCLIPVVIGKTLSCRKLLYFTQKWLRVIFLLYKSEHIVPLLKYFNASPFLSR